MVQNADIVMEDVYVPDEDRLTGINSFQDTNKVEYYINWRWLSLGSQLTAQKDYRFFTKR